MRLILMYKKNLSSFQRRSVENIPSKLLEKRGESQLDCLNTKSFLTRVVLSPLSQIFFKKNMRLIVFFKKCIVGTLVEK